MTLAVLGILGKSWHCVCSYYRGYLNEVIIRIFRKMCCNYEIRELFIFIKDY